MTDVYIPKTVETIIGSAFYGCKNIEQLIIPASVVDIGGSVFRDCSSLTMILFEGNAPTVGSSCFLGVDASCVARVSRKTSGWTVDGEGRWNGLILEYIETEQDLIDELKDFADSKLAEYIKEGKSYTAFLTWVSGLKGVSFDQIKSSPNAWLSYALDLPALIEGEMSESRLKMLSFEPMEDNLFAIRFGLDGVDTGDNAEVGNIVRSFAVEGAQSLEDDGFSVTNVAVEAALPEDGAVMVAVAPRVDSDSFFFRTRLLDGKNGVNMNGCPVSFDLGNGGVLPNGVSSQIYVPYTAEYGALPMPTRAGYKFLGWFTAPSGGENVDAESKMGFESARTLYAQWEKVERDSVQLWEGGPYWATTNIGAEKPEDYGYYFWWGDTVGYKRENDKWMASDGSNSDFSFESDHTPTYGKSTLILQGEGWITSEGALAPEHDAATIHWGNEWRMPTAAELSALTNNCDWMWTTTNGVNGYIVRGKGKYVTNSIFLPCAGLGVEISFAQFGLKGNYWSSNPGSDNFNCAWRIYFDSGRYITYCDPRYYGRSIRPVEVVACGVVTFNVSGGSSIDPISIVVGRPVGALPVPTRDGYTFAGWWTAASGGTQVTASTVVTGSVTYYARWQINMYSVGFDANGGTEGITVSRAHGETLGELPAPTRDGYTFVGWWTATIGGTQVDASMVVTGNATYYARWQINTYLVSFNANGGAGGTTVSREYGETLGTLPTPTRDGYTFTGWWTEANVCKQATVSTVVTGNVTYYAHWQINTYSVCFDVNGGTGGTTVSREYGETLGTLPTPTRDGYTFAGWWTAASGGTQVDASTVVMGNATYYAQWQNNMYLVSLKANGGTGGTIVTRAYGEPLGELPTPTRDGYTFVGWWTAASVGEQATASTLVTGDVTYYAHWKGGDAHEKVQLWEGGPYWATMNIGAEEPWDAGYGFWWGDIIGYTYENGAWVANDGSLKLDDSVRYIVPTSDKSISTLQSEGWITSDNVLVPAHDAANVRWANGWRMPTAGELGELGVYCDWVRTNTNGVRGYVVCGRGAYASNSIFLPDASSYTYWDTDGSYWNYTGCYWSSDPGSDDYKKSKCFCFRSEKWSDRWLGILGFRRESMLRIRPVQVCGMVTFNVNGGSAIKPISIAIGYPFGSLPMPTRDAYTFVGWRTARGEWVTASTIMTESVTLYAQWEERVKKEKVQLWEGGPYWATTNIGAEEPWDYGYYFWWGDTVGYKRENDKWVASDGSNSNFEFCISNTPTFYKSTSTLQSEGWITSDNVLVPEHDAAYINWGKGWRMPTDDELHALNEKCDLTWTTMNGVAGYVVRGRGVYASNSIFLPAAGEGDGYDICWGSSNQGITGNIWSAVLNPRYFAYNLCYFASVSVLTDSNRYYGYSVRPIQDVDCCTITFNVNGGLFINPTSITVGQPLGALPTPIRYGYAFAGWWTAASGGVQVSASTVVTGNVTYYAHWTINTYTVTFNANGGEGGTALTRAYGATLGSLPTPTREGYTFGGWWTVASGGTQVATSTTVTGNVTYYAHWIESTCTVTFNANGGEGGTALTRAYGAILGSLPTPTREGYTFGGWWTMASGGTRVTASTVVTGNITFYAHWQEFVSHDMVQLWEGGPYWATTNIGADNPWDYGYYFWWGDTVGYKRENDKWMASDGSSSNFSFCRENTPTYDKLDSTLQSEGWITADGVLAPEYDAAQAHWGGNWRVPTKTELNALISNCDWTWTTKNGVDGYIVRGKGAYVSNSIFLPCAGCGNGASLSHSGSDGGYWFSVPYSGYSNAWSLDFNSGYRHACGDGRFYGLSVRPVAVLPK